MRDTRKTSRPPSRDFDISKSSWLQPNVNWIVYLTCFVALYLYFVLGGMDLDAGWRSWILPAMILAALGFWYVWIAVARRGLLTWMRLARAPAKTMARGDAAGAERAFAKALARARRFAPDDRRRGLMFVELAGFAKNQGRYAESQGLYDECIEILQHHRRTDPTGYFIALNNYAIYYIHLRDYQAAQRMLENALDLTLVRKMVQPLKMPIASLTSQIELILHLNLVFLFIEMRALGEAADHLAEADRLFPGLSSKARARYGDHYQAIRALLMYAEGRFASAAEEIAAAENPDHPTCLRVRARLALVRQDFVKAEQLLGRCFDEQRKKGVLHLPEMRDSMLDYAESLVGQGKDDEAFAAFQEARSIVADFALPPGPRWRSAVEGWIERARERGRMETIQSLETELRTIVATPEEGIMVSDRLRIRPPAG